MGGINRALYEQRHLAKASNPCVFLSHISVDKSTAIAIGDYIKKQGDIDIYLDLNDEELQRAVKRDDPTGITKFIEQGLSYSTHIMCLVSAAPVESWWVPYELGFAKNAGKHLSTLKLKGEIALPAYLQISEIIFCRTAAVGRNPVTPFGGEPYGFMVKGILFELTPPP